MSHRLPMSQLLLPLSAALCVLALATVACGGKSNDIVAQQQVQQSKDACPQGCTTSLPGCVVKGNISAKGNKFYHTLDQPSYKGIIIQPDKGERWFCTEQEAINNGWVKSAN